MSERQKGISKFRLATALAFFSAVVSACSGKKEQLPISIPQTITGQVDQTIPIPADLWSKYDENCPPLLGYDSSLATASVTVDEASHMATLTVIPGQNIESPFKIEFVAQVNNGIFGGVNCAPVEDASGSATTFIDTKPTDCAVIGSTDQNTQLQCSGDGVVQNLTDGGAANIINGQVAMPILNSSREAQLQVVDPNGNVSELVGVLKTDCTPPVDMVWSESAQRYVGTSTCNGNAVLESSAGGSVTAFPNQPVQVNLDGGDNAVTTVTAHNGPLSTQTTFTNGVQNAPDVLVSDLSISHSQDVATVVCKDAANRAPCIVNGVQIPAGTSAEVAVSSVVVDNGTPVMVPITVSDPAHRTVTLARQQPHYPAFDSVSIVQAFFQNIDGGRIQITINTGDPTQSITRILLKGEQDAPFTPQNIVHKLLEEIKGTEMDCTEAVQRVNAPQVFDATCTTLYGDAGPVSINATLYDGAGNSQAKPLDVYNTTAPQGNPEFIRPYYPNTAELALNIGGIVAGLITTVGIGGIISTAIANTVEERKEKKLDHTLDLLWTPYDHESFTLVEDSERKLEVDTSDKRSLAARIEKNITDAPYKRHALMLELWNRKKRNIILGNTPTMIQTSSDGNAEIYNSKALIDLITENRIRKAEDKEFAEKVEGQPKSQKKLKDTHHAIERENHLIVGRVVLGGLNTYIGTVINNENKEIVEVDEAVFNPELTKLAIKLLEEGDHSWIWKRIQEGEANIDNIGEKKPFGNLSKHNLLAIVFAHLKRGKYNNFFTYKKILQRYFGEGFSRKKAEEMGEKHYKLVKNT